MSEPKRTYLPFVIMFLLAAHMLPIDQGLLGYLWYLRQRAQLMFCPQVAALMFLLAQIVLIYLVGRIVAWLIPRHTSPTIYQIRLSTSFVIMLAASVILFANVNSYDYGSNGWRIVGWPATSYLRPDEGILTFSTINAWLWNFLFSLYMLGGLVLFCEWVQRAAGVSPLIIKTASEKPLTTPLFLRGYGPVIDDLFNYEPTDSQIPELTRRYRIAFAMPMLLFFTALLLLPALLDPVINDFAALRIDLPLPMRALMSLSRWVDKYPSIFVTAMALTTLFYVGWVSKTRCRVFWFAVIFLALIFFGLFFACAAILISYFGDPPCIAEGTDVETPDGFRRIENLQVGDKVCTASADGEIQAGVIQQKWSAVAMVHLHFVLDNGSELSATEKHPISGWRGWTEAGQLSVDDEVRCRDGYHRIVSIEKRRGTLRVYDLAVEPNSNFFANGVLVHNKLRKK